MFFVNTAHFSLSRHLQIRLAMIPASTDKIKDISISNKMLRHLLSVPDLEYGSKPIIKQITTSDKIAIQVLKINILLVRGSLKGLITQIRPFFCFLGSNNRYT